MSVETTTTLLKASSDRDWAVPQFNSHNMMMMKAALAAASSEKAPIIMAAGYQSFRFFSIRTLAHVMRALSEETEVPVAIHLDHARELCLVEKALEYGFSSVMFDGSSLPFEENIQKTRRVVEMARDAGASVEGEVGIVPAPGAKPGESGLTDVDQAVEFAERTGVDLLAVSLGSVHGMTETSLSLDQGLLKKLGKALSVPLVLHGASGVTDDAVRQAIGHGVRKINVNTALKALAAKRMAAVMTEKPNMDLLEVMDAGGQAITELAVHKIRVFGASGRIH